MGDNKLELVILVNAGQANDALQSVNKSMAATERQTVQSAQNMSKGADDFGTKMYQARSAAMMLEGQIGVKLPAAVNAFLANSSLIGPMLEKAFAATAIISVGTALAGGISKLWEWISASKQLKEISEAAATAISKEKDEIHKLNEEYSLIGLKGAARQEEEARRGLDRTQAALAQARTALANLKANRPASAIAREEAMKSSISAPYAAGINVGETVWQSQVDAAKTMISTLEAQEEKYRTALRVGMRNLLDEHKEAEKKKTEDAKREQDQRLKNLENYLNETRKLEIAAIQDPAARLGVQRLEDLKAAAKPTPGVGAAQIAERQRALNAKAIADLQNIWLQGTKKIKEVNPLEGETELYRAQVKAEQKELDEFIKTKKKEIQAGEEAQEQLRKGEEEALRETERLYERRADAIEGFIHRTFLTARSFTDVWKQALTQVADYAVSQFARMAAAWSMGQRSMMPAGAGAGAGSVGTIGGVGSLFGAGQSAGSPGMGSGGTPPFLPNSGGGVGQGGGFGGLMNMGTGWKNFLGIGGSSPNGIGPTLPFGQMSLGGKLSALGKSNAALMGGAALALMGVQRGGISGMAMTTAGGALIGFKYGGPLGAAIGGAIGLGVGIVGLFRKSAEKKVREKVQATYGIDIQDKGVREQIVEMAKQSYGGNLDMAIRSQQVQDLVRLYAMTTGQKTGGLPQQMTAGSLVQRGGGLYQQTQYVNGQAIRSPGGQIPAFHTGIDYVPRDMLAFLKRGERVTPAIQNSPLPGAGLSAIASRREVNYVPRDIYLSPEAAQNLLTQGVLHIMNANPRTIQSGATKATKSNFNRRELTSLQLSPGTLTS
jgi:hypothetical protein